MHHIPPRALIAEDEPILAEMLARSLYRLWPELQICAVAGDGVTALSESLACKPDVLFLDIKMPGRSGIEVARELAEAWPQERPFPLVVFVTAYDEYALQAFEQAAADYVLKPVNDTRLEKTIARLRQRLESADARRQELERVVGQLRTLLPAAPAQPAAKLDMVRAAVGSQVRLIPVEKVLYFEAADKYVNVVCADGEALIRTSLKELLPQLDPERFWQVHRGTVVNVREVQAAHRDDSGRLSLSLHGHERRLPVSRLFAHLFRQM
ncbi:two component transcriptional regulator, LytTR family [Noviherbaspirillum humi]|uniref:Two component transcriptional regulator, LytTR family n=1 Tax=Noviherbaspirillum humi TaxID=1688639 RepID=A0A239KDW5_9BURK|nr:LytTR family DNA-binding domain-containing protein [Noviherbaspirillum humi]SNT16547.1 two component transcriptional regulator, LytTR family [Noviherbaspirillum humi]